LSIQPKTGAIRDSLLQDEAHMLQRLGRVDEMVDNYDRRVKDAYENPALRLALLRRKGTALIGQPDVERTIAALRDYQAATEPKSEKWRDATALIAFALERAERYREAIVVRKQVLDLDPLAAGWWLVLARDQQALGLNDEARKSLDEAEINAQALSANKANRPTKAQQARFEEEIAKVRKLVGPAAN
jgi:tetratricopeptide (TPR) repeat protein